MPWKLNVTLVTAREISSDRVKLLNNFFKTESNIHKVQFKQCLLVFRVDLPDRNINASSKLTTANYS